MIFESLRRLIVAVVYILGFGFSFIMIIIAFTADNLSNQSLFTIIIASVVLVLFTFIVAKLVNWIFQY